MAIASSYMHFKDVEIDVGGSETLTYIRNL